MRVCLVAAVLALGAPAAVAQQFRQRDFDAYVRRGLQTLRVPGAAVAVVKDGKLSTTVAFPEPGTYVIRAYADDGVLAVPADVTIVVGRGAKPSGQQ